MFHITIEEILRRTVQGVTQPFVCRDTEGRTYAVKGVAGCGKDALRAEWVAGRIGQQLKLPIPPFAQAEIPSELIEYSAVPGVVQLGGGPAFASLWQDDSQELTWTICQKIATDIRTRLLLFDWLVLNGDRSLTTLGGNPNVIYAGNEHVIAVIDHQAAFDPEFDTRTFWAQHACQDTRPLWTPSFRAEYQPILEQIGRAIGDSWDELPDEWFEDENRTGIASTLEMDRIRTIVMRCQTQPDTFWNGIL